jgi:3-hydroxybutyryl-CoA dehydrogenase
MQVADLIGLEVNLEVTRSVWEQWGRPRRFEPPRVQQELVARGEHGQKTGRGVYDHSSSPPAASWTVEAKDFRMTGEVEAAVEDFVRAAALCDEEAVAAAPTAERYAFARILGTVLNEAERTRSDGSATAEDIDVALQRGTNYPRGPIEWARGIGHARVARLLRALNAEGTDGRYEPAGDFASA